MDKKDKADLEKKITGKLLLKSVVRFMEYSVEEQEVYVKGQQDVLDTLLELQALEEGKIDLGSMTEEQYQQLLKNKENKE